MTDLKLDQLKTGTTSAVSSSLAARTISQPGRDEIGAAAIAAHAGTRAPRISTPQVRSTRPSVMNGRGSGPAR